MSGGPSNLAFTGARGNVRGSAGIDRNFGAERVHCQELLVQENVILPPGGATDQVVLASQLAAANAIVIDANNAAGGIDVDSGTGGLDVDTTGQLNLDSSQAAATAVRVNASNAAGGIDVDAGTGGIAVDTTGALSLDSTLAANLTTAGGAGVDLTLASTAGSVNITAGEAILDSININSTAGGVDIRGAIANASAIDIDAPSGGINGVAGGAAGGAGDISWISTLGSTQLQGGEAAADAILMLASAAGGGITLTSGTAGTGVRVDNGLVARSSTAAAITGVTTLSAADSGGVFSVAKTGVYAITLPTPAQGIEFTFMVLDTGANIVTITSPGAFNFGVVSVNNVNTASTGTNVLLASAGSVGDWVHYQGIDATHYLVTGACIAAADITFT